MWPATSSGEEEQRLPEYVLVAYPGVVKNAEKAIETLGGPQTLSAVSFIYVRCARVMTTAVMVTLPIRNQHFSGSLFQ